MTLSQRDLTRILSGLQGFEKPSVALEQYATPPHIAADWLWKMAKQEDIAGKVILDAACGPGILGIGLLLLGAKKVYFLDKDARILEVCRGNVENVGNEYVFGEALFLEQGVEEFAFPVEVVVQNPPFGTKNAHIDKIFLEKALSVARVVYTMHKWSTRAFVEAVARDFQFQVTDVWQHDFSLKAQFAFHKKPVRDVEVGLWRLERIKKSI